MKITIEPETDAERESADIEYPRIYRNLCEFAFVGTYLEHDVVPRPIVHTHGDTMVLFGKLAEAQERLRVQHQMEISRKHNGPVD